MTCIFNIWCTLIKMAKDRKQWRMISLQEYIYEWINFKFLAFFTYNICIYSFNVEKIHNNTTLCYSTTACKWSDSDPASTVSDGVHSASNIALPFIAVLFFLSTPPFCKVVIKRSAGVTWSCKMAWAVVTYGCPSISNAAAMPPGTQLPIASWLERIRSPVNAIMWSISHSPE